MFLQVGTLTQQPSHSQPTQPTEGAPLPSLHTNQSENKEVFKTERSRRESPCALRSLTLLASFHVRKPKQTAEMSHLICENTMFMKVIQILELNCFFFLIGSIINQAIGQSVVYAIQQLTFSIKGNNKLSCFCQTLTKYFKWQYSNCCIIRLILILCFVFQCLWIYILK